MLIPKSYTPLRLLVTLPICAPDADFFNETCQYLIFSPTFTYPSAVPSIAFLSSAIPASNELIGTLDITQSAVFALDPVLVNPLFFSTE